MNRIRAVHGVPAFLVARVLPAVLFALSAFAPGPARAQNAPEPLPFVHGIAVGPAGEPDRPPLPQPMCATDSIRVFVFGTFPDDCHSLKRVELLDLDLAQGPSPVPPIVRLVVDDGSCLDRPCTVVPVPWHAAITLLPLPAGSYELIVELEVTDCTEPPPPDSVSSARVPFAVVEECAAYSCLLPSWDHGGHQSGCDATVAPGDPADVFLLLRTPVALAGLQGSLQVYPEGLVIREITAIGPAAGMRLAWTKTESGARFLMFAEEGAPIPPSDDSEPPPQVLQVTLEQPPGLAAPPTTYVSVLSVLGADAAGGGVPECNVRTLGLIFEAAVICSRRMCDWNNDGTGDVRDLVGMVRCLNDATRCGFDPDRTDCNRDGGFTLDDVICCARQILTGDRPDSTGTRPEPAVSVHFGAPVSVGDAVSLPLRIEGASRLGAALLGLAFPRDRYELVEVTPARGSEAWLFLSQPTGSGAGLGAIALAPRVGVDEDAPLDLVLRFARHGNASGDEPGGTVRVTDWQFAGTEGALLEVALGSPVATLDPSSGVALAPPEPNPFSNSVRLVLHLTAPEEVTLDVLDVAGRRVASLHSGALPAGSHPFLWDGRRSDGTTAANGVYFARTAATGVVLSRRIILLRNQ